MFQIISGTSKTVSGTQNLERNVPTTAHKNVPTNSRLLGTLFQLAFPVETGISAAGGESSTGDGGLSLLKVANITLNPGPTYDNYTASDHENAFRCLVKLI